MASSTTIRFTLFFILFQIFCRDVSEAKDDVQRTGIVLRMMEETEVKALDKNEVTIDGKAYVKQKVANGREVDFDSKKYFAILTGYCEKTVPTNCIDIIVILSIMGIETSKFVAGAKLVKLADDADFKLGVIEHQEPHSLEFVTVDKNCGVMEDSDTLATITFHDCSRDNFHPYTKIPSLLTLETNNIGQSLHLYYQNDKK